MRIAYGEVTFELTRYDLGGKVTDRDVEVAKKISPCTERARSRRGAAIDVTADVLSGDPMISDETCGITGLRAIG